MSEVIELLTRAFGRVADCLGGVPVEVPSPQLGEFFFKLPMTGRVFRVRIDHVEG